LKLIDKKECYSNLPKAKYGFDAYGNKVEAPESYFILEKMTRLKEEDIPFDVYAGWLDNKFNKRYHIQAISEGRWTTWARKTGKNNG